MSSAPLSDRLHSAARVVMAALGDRHRVLPRWAIAYLLAALERLSKGAVELLRKLEAGTYRPRKPARARRQAAPPRAPRPAPAIPFPGFRGIVADLIGSGRSPINGPSLHELLQDPALPGYVQACPALARRLRPLCRLVGAPIPEWLRPPPRPRPSGPQESGPQESGPQESGPRRPRARRAPAQRPAPDPSKPSWRLLRAAARADIVMRHWRDNSAAPAIMLHGMRHMLSKEVINLLRPTFKFLNVMYP
jgi:hypothetical protein